MIKHDLKNWIYTNDLEGLLFFAQRLNEALFDFSPDRYKAPTLFTISSCLELLRTASSVKNGVFPLKTLETVFEEFKSIYNKDIIAQELVGVDAKNYFLEITESNLEKFITGIELLIMKMPPREYLNLLKEKLKEAIVSCKRKREIEDYSLKYISILTHLGYTQDFLYRKTCDFFFKKNMINNVNNIDEFYSLFDLKVKRYNIYLKISRLFRPLEEMCKGFKISIVEDEELSSKLKLTPQDEILIKVEQIELYDPYGAQIYVDRLLNKINNLFTFYYHKQRLSWSAEAVVKEMDSKDEGFHIKKRVTSMQKGIDYYPQAAAKLLGNKYQVYENGYQISERGYAYNNEMINSVDSEYSTSNEEMNIDDELTMKLLQREKEIRSAVDELARLGDSPSLSVNEVLKIQLLKQTIVRNYDEALNIAQQTGDKDLVREYERRRDKTVRALQMMKR